MDTDERIDWHDHVPGYLAVGITVMVASAYAALLFVPIPKDNMQLVIQASTALFGGWALAIGFYFNTNKNSAKAQDTLNVQARTAAALGAAVTPSTPSVPVEPGETGRVVGTDKTE